MTPAPLTMLGEKLCLPPHVLEEFKIGKATSRDSWIYPTAHADKSAGQYRFLRDVGLPDQPCYRWRQTQDLQNTPGYNLPKAAEKMKPFLYTTRQGENMGPLCRRHRKRFSEIWIVNDGIDVWTMNFAAITAVSPFDGGGYDELVDALATTDPYRVHIALRRDKVGRDGALRLATACQRHGIRFCVYTVSEKCDLGIGAFYRNAICPKRGCKHDLYCKRQVLRDRLEAIVPVEPTKLS